MTRGFAKWGGKCGCFVLIKNDYGQSNHTVNPGPTIKTFKSAMLMMCVNFSPSSKYLTLY